MMFLDRIDVKHYSSAMKENKVIYYSTAACLVLGSGVLFYKYLMRKYNKHKKNGIPGPKARLFVGCTRDMMEAGVLNYDKNMVDQYGKLVGIYMGSTPALIISDLDILKEVLVKHFDQFCNRSARGQPQYPIRKMVNMLEFDHWKHVRNLLTPTFSGGKLRRMNTEINECCQELVNNLLQKCENGDVVELKQESGKFTMNVIAATTYGIDISSKEDNERFVETMNKMMSHGMTSRIGRLKIFLIVTFPWMFSLFKMTFFPKECTDFFVGVFNGILKRQHMERDPAAKNNFLDMMTELYIEDPKESDLKMNEFLVKSKQGYIYSTKGLTHEEILAQSFIFFLAGFDTTSTSLSFLLYNLACYPEVQETLYNEINDAMGDKTEPDYDVIKKMTYLQMCIDESGRLYPPAFRFDRSCNEDIEIKGLKIEKGMTIVVPVFSIHRNPDIWPEPDQFKPERFTPEEKLARHPMAHLPFGLGPRHCVGMRLALMEMKFAIIQLVRNFRFITCDETQIPLKLHNSRMMAADGLKVKLLKR